MSKRIKLLCLVLSAVLLFTGCTARTMQEMYRLPKRSEDYRDLQKVIDGAMVDMEYCAPLAGENQQTVQLADLDGDGKNEYLLFAKGNHEKPLHILVFKNEKDSFTQIGAIACNGSAFDQVEYVDMDGRGGMEIVVGRQLSDQVIRSVSVYTFKDHEVFQLATMNYTRFMIADLDGDALSELFLLRPGQTETDNGVAELYTMKSGSIERYNEVSLSQPADKLKRMIAGKLSGGKSAVYTASAVGDQALITDVYTLIDGKLSNVTLSNESGTSVHTMRNFYVYADDIDSDGIVELPSLITMKPLSAAMSDDMHHLIRWYAMTQDGGEKDKIFTYHNFVGGWYLQLDSQWASRLGVLHFGNQTEFYIWNKTYESKERVLTLYSFTGQNREEQGLSKGRFVLHKTDSVVYAALLEEAAAKYGITQESMVYSFRMIQQDWKTGET